MAAMKDDAKLKELQPVHDANHLTGRLGAPRTCQEGTRVKLIQEIWGELGDVTEGSPRIVWLKGKAGTGKSTVSQTICEQAAAQGQLGASFFCSRTGAETLSNPRGILPTIAFQLAHVYPEFGQGVIAALQRRPELPTARPQEQFDDLIITPFAGVETWNKQPTLIVVDALDECEKSLTEQLLTVLVKGAERLPPHVKILITSRPELHIRSVLEPPNFTSSNSPNSAPTSASSPTPPHMHAVLVHDIESAADTAADIRSYLKTELEAISTHLQVEFSVSPTAFETLATRSGDLFIIAATYARFIGSKGLSNPTGRLELILNSTIPSGVPSIPELDKIYSAILRLAIPEDLATDEEEEYFDGLRQVLGMIVLLRDHLSMADMERLAGRTRDSVRIALMHLHSVISVPTSPSQGSPEVHHPSFADFLCDRNRCKDERFFIDVEEHQRRLAVMCFDRLAASLSQRFPHHQDPAVPNSDVKDLQEEIKSNFLPDIQYACRHWAPHLSRVARASATGDSEVMRALDQFLQKRLIWWIEAMSLLGGLKDAIEGLIDARTWLVRFLVHHVDTH